MPRKYLTAIDQFTLKLLLDYNVRTGKFHWKVPRQKVKVGAVAGYLDPISGYVLLCVKGRLYRAHRLAWLYYYGEWSKMELDHINRNRADNRIGNLREVSHWENMNNKERDYVYECPRAVKEFPFKKDTNDAAL